MDASRITGSIVWSGLFELLLITTVSFGKQTLDTSWKLAVLIRNESSCRFQKLGVSVPSVLSSAVKALEKTSLVAPTQTYRYPIPDFRESQSGKGMGHTRSEWKKVVNAIEESIPLYELISERISFNLAGPLRRRAIGMLNARRTDWVLDSGAGPGVSSGLLISRGFQKVVGLDPSRKLLRFAASSLGPEFHPVVGVAEKLPFRDSSFRSTLTCFALRDVQEPGQSVSEFSRVIGRRGRLCVVDVGKPDRAFERIIIGLYVRKGMPRLARLLVRGRIRGNPFQMIVPTFERLSTNRRLESLVAREFGPSRLKEFMFGGLVIVEAERAG